MMDSTDSAAKPAASTSSRPPTTAEAVKTAPAGSNNAGFRNNPPDDDDEEEEGMLKVDEEGQIEDDGADQQVSPPSYRGDGARPISLADRLTPFPDASAAKSGGAGPSHSNGSGYVSPRHMNLDRERDRDRDRYLETSPGPSSAFGASRSRYGHPSDTAGAYGASAPYSYPSGHRDPHRADSFSSASRAGFSAAAGAARADARRGWYPPATPTRGPDTYRPGAVRERERDREWESFRGEREWSAIDRDREREAYRDMVDKRRDWPARERGVAPFSYDMADSAAPYPAPASSKYSSRDPTGRRPLSPQPLSARERDFEADRSRDRDRERASERDPRMRASSSGWTNGMRQWGKPSDAGWDNRSTRPPTSDDARSDASQRPSLSRSNNTPPPATSSEGPGRPIGSDNASVKSETRSREMTPHSQSAPHGGRARSAATETQAKGATERDGNVSTAIKKEAVEQELSASQQPSAKADAEARPTAPEVAPAAKAEPDAASEAAKPETTPAPSPQEEQLSADKAATSSEPPVKQLQEQSEESTNAATSERADEVPAAPGSTNAQRTAAPASIAEAAVDEQPTVVTSEAADQAKEDESTAETAEMPSKDAVSEKEEGEANASPTTAEAEPKSTTVEAPEASEPTGDEPPANAEPLSADQSVSDDQKPARDAAKDEATSAGPSAPETQYNSMDTQPAEPLADAGTDDATSKQQSSQASLTEAVASTGPDRISAPAETASTDAAPARTEAPGPSESVQAPEHSVSEPKVTDTADVDMADAVPEQPSASSDVLVPRADAPAPTSTPDEMSKAETKESLNEPITQDTQPRLEQDVEMSQEPASEPLLAADNSVRRVSQPPVGDIEKPMPVGDKLQEQEAEVQAPAEQPTAVASVIESSAVLLGTDVGPNDDDASTTKAAPDAETPVQLDVKVEESAVQGAEDVEMEEAKAADEPSSNGLAESPQAAPPASVSDEAVTTSEPAAQQPSQTQVSGPHVTATIDHEKRTKEITLPQVNYGDDKQAQALVQQENARIEEVERPSENHKPAPLRIAEADDDSQVEPPLMTPTTQEQLERSIRTAVRLHIHEFAPDQDDWKRILVENQRVAQKTTMDVLTAKIHGIPQTVSSVKPLWLEEKDGLTDRTKAVLFDRLLDRKKRLNEKTESLKKRYRSINEEWKQHCSRLDRIAERREIARRPPATTPAGTPGAFGGVEDPSPGSAGASLLGASFATGRANRRSAQAGFAGFGDAVRSEAEFLEILASLENADMQDPNMRAARTTATAPDMYINPDSDQPLKLRYDDVNGSVADPLAFYLDEFDPDFWSEEEKAIFARRYALWPKQFGKIAQALPHKTPAQCVRYYYLNKKLPGNDFKALAAARNRERKRKARVKPKKVKGSALMADLKSAKGEEVDEVEDSSGMRSPMDATDPSGVSADLPASANSRRGGRSRLGLAAVDSGAGAHSDDAATGRKRHVDQIESESSPAETKASEKRKSGAKSKRAKSDSASATDKSRKSKAGGKKDIAALEDKKGSTAAPSPAVAKTVAAQPAAVTEASAPVKGSLEDSDLAAAEALGALAGLFGAAPPSEAGVPSAAPASSDPTAVPLEAKAGKKRRSKTAAPGEDGAAEGTPKGRGRQPTSSYWSVAERSEFLRALVVHGPRWDVVSSTLAQKSAAQARNYFARNESEPDFAEAAALARSHAELPVSEREEAALTFVRQRFANNAAATTASAAPNAATNMAGGGAGLNGDVPRTTHLPPPPGIVTSQADGMDVKMREGSPEVLVQRRGLQINSLLNDTSDTHVKRRSSLHEWQEQREVAAHAGAGREASVPPALYARPPFELERRPVTAEAPRPLSSDGRPGLDDVASRPRVYEREGSVDSRSWAYEAPVAGPGHVARSVPPLSTHAHASDEAEHDRDRSLYGTYGGAGRTREYEAHSMPPAVPGELRHGSGEQVSPTGASFGAGHAYGRYAPPSVGSIYASSAAATTALSARGRSANGPLTAPLPATSERPAYEQRWQRYSQSPGPPGTSATSSGGGGIAGGFSTGSAYRSSASPYSSFPSQSLPRPSLPSLSAGAAKGAPHLPPLGAAGRSLPPILGSFPAPGRGLGGAARPAGTGEEARYWPYPQRPRGHDAQNRNPE
ncbi:hypothetical protein PANT_7d00280 [Moesziomyces antarcticus T-34]|uniref:SANT domain-containing protein n=1 Tax=Pseudozyma antarctica (strain T-34) TaxID=1151754 RepID=M9LMJ3_PSEA3|nr:hypothetical protein PANT_7d00280 [Moesziomyces antarcticus T-34]